MESTGFSINKESWALLRDEPLYSARFIDRADTDELVLVVRVEVLEWFLEMHPPLLLDLTSWCSPRGVWVVILSYQLRANFGPTKGGSFYLNPRQSAEADILRKLTVRDSLPVVFLSEDCETHYTTKALLNPQLVTLWQKQINEINLGLKGKPMIDLVDEEFETAMRELQMEER